MNHNIGFVFLCPKGLSVAINSFFLGTYILLPILKLALFFQITFFKTLINTDIHSLFCYVRGTPNGEPWTTNYEPYNWVCFHQVSNPLNLSYLFVLTCLAHIWLVWKLGLFFQIAINRRRRPEHGRRIYADYAA